MHTLAHTHAQSVQVAAALSAHSGAVIQCDHQARTPTQPDTSHKHSLTTQRTVSLLLGGGDDGTGGACIGVSEACGIVRQPARTQCDILQQAAVQAQAVPDCVWVC
jgi:hypothetical protein